MVETEKSKWGNNNLNGAKNDLRGMAPFHSQHIRLMTCLDFLVVSEWDDRTPDETYCHLETVVFYIFNDFAFLHFQ